jgi:hypothetical protein
VPTVRVRKAFDVCYVEYWWKLWPFKGRWHMCVKDPYYENLAIFDSEAEAIAFAKDVAGRTEQGEVIWANS